MKTNSKASDEIHELTFTIPHAGEVVGSQGLLVPLLLPLLFTSVVQIGFHIVFGDFIVQFVFFKVILRYLLSLPQPMIKPFLLLLLSVNILQ